jgi:hypothetical protein
MVRLAAGVDIHSRVNPSRNDDGESNARHGRRVLRVPAPRVEAALGQGYRLGKACR